MKPWTADDILAGTKSFVPPTRRSYQVEHSGMTVTVIHWPDNGITHYYLAWGSEVLASGMRRP